MAEHVAEGNINQFINGLMKIVPEKIRQKSEFINYDYQGYIRDYINVYFVTEGSEQMIGFSILQQPKANEISSYKKRQKRAIVKIKTNYEKDREAFLAGEKPGKYTPFGDDMERMVESGFIDKAEAVKIADERYEKWCEDLKIPNSCNSDQSEITWHGLMDYPYVVEYRVDKNYRQFLELDLQGLIYLYAEQNIKKYKYTANISTKTSAFASGSVNASVRQGYDVDEAINNGETLVAGYRSNFEMIIDGTNLDLKVASVYEASALAYMFTEAIKSYASGSGSFTVSGTETDLCEAIFGTKKKYSLREYQKARDAIEILRNLVLWSKDNTTTAPLFEYIRTDWTAKNADGSEKEKEKTTASRFSAKFGAFLISDIIATRYSLINTKEMDSLESSAGLAKLLYARLRRDRIETAGLRKQKQTIYSYLELSMIAKAMGRNRKERETNYIAAIQEMKDKHILVKDFTYLKNRPLKEPMLTIVWEPLSDAEVLDIIRINVNDDTVIEGPNIIDAPYIEVSDPS